jgi:hypothetical protein
MKWTDFGRFWRLLARHDDGSFGAFAHIRTMTESRQRDLGGMPEKLNGISRIATGAMVSDLPTDRGRK